MAARKEFHLAVMTRRKVAPVCGCVCVCVLALEGGSGCWRRLILGDTVQSRFSRVVICMAVDKAAELKKALNLPSPCEAGPLKVRKK